MAAVSSSTLNTDQKAALRILESQDNVFVTGAAGSGKSFLMRTYLKDSTIPILASTGAAAILVGGRTFHSFFGLGILEGGPQKTIERAIKNSLLVKRIQKATAVVIDEISMISGPTLAVAEKIARKVRENDSPWGGLRVIAVGDFAQLPPVNPFTQAKEWAFLSEVWAASQFKPAVLREPMRTRDRAYLDVLNEIRAGRLSDQVKEFLNTQQARLALNQSHEKADVTRLFSLREKVEAHNLSRLEEIDEPIHKFETLYHGKEKDVEQFRKNSPVADQISLKKGALVMLRQNDPEGRWVNGTTGIVEKISDELLWVRLLSGRCEDEEVEIPKTDFTLLNAAGEPVVSATNFPVTLAWAMTIHKAQGATLEKVSVDLRRVWEAGQAYVALSRAQSSKGLQIEGWHPSAIKADPSVSRFYDQLGL